MPSNLPPKRYDAPDKDVCEMLAETLPRVSIAEEHESQDFAKRLIELQDKKRKGLNTLKVGNAFPWLYQLGLITYQGRYMNRGGHRLFLARKASETAVKSAMEARPWVFNGKWHSQQTQAAVAQGENPHPPFVEPPTKSEVEHAEKTLEADKPKKKKKKRKKKKGEKKDVGKSVNTFVKSWTEAIENLPSTKKRKSSETDGETRHDRASKVREKFGKAERSKKKRTCCDSPHVVRSKKTGKRWCKNCGAKYKSKKPKS